MEFKFPEIKTTRSEEEQAQKVIDEIEEFLSAKTEDHKDEELIDVLHAVETLIRIRIKNGSKNLDDIIKFVIDKNTNRGYYKKECF